MSEILSVVAAYVIGAIPFGYLIAKMVRGIDIRTEGSGNVGATNVFRVVGKRWGVLALILDVLKGVLAVQVVPSLIPAGTLNPDVLALILGIVAVCGHNWTIFLGFKGGKGVATTCGVMLALFPKAILVCVAVFVVIVALTRYVSLGSIIGACCFPVLLWVFYSGRDSFAASLVFGLVLAYFIIIRHKANIKRLLKGQENKIVFKKKNQE